MRAGSYVAKPSASAVLMSGQEEGDSSAVAHRRLALGSQDGAQDVKGV